MNRFMVKRLFNQRQTLRRFGTNDDIWSRPPIGEHCIILTLTLIFDDHLSAISPNRLNNWMRLQHPSNRGHFKR